MAEQYTERPTEIEVFPLGSETDVILRKSIAESETTGENGDVATCWQCEERQIRVPGTVSAEDIAADFEAWWEYTPGTKAQSVEDVRTETVAQMSATCNAAIVGGVDVTLTGGETKHFSLTLEDQLNLLSLQGRVASGADSVPYHADGEECSYYSAADFGRIADAATRWKLYQESYFNALYQGIPIGGYTKMIANLLDGIEVRLNTDYLENKAELDELADKVVYTGPIDAYFDYKLGTLEYRSVRFENEILDKPSFQGNAAVNYTDRETPWTRIIEHKWFEFGKDENGNDLPKTIISREYSSEWKPGDEPYYPVNDAKNSLLYSEYKKLAEAESKVIFGGRLGEYKYYDMDQVIAAVLDKCASELGEA